MIYRYKLNEDGTVPWWVEDGGYFHNTANDTYIAHCPNINKNSAMIVSQLESEGYNRKYTLKGLISRELYKHYDIPLYEKRELPDNKVSIMTEDAIEKMVKDWAKERGISD